MKALLVITTLFFSTLALADTVYVRKSVTESGVSAADGETVRSILKKAVADQGHALATSGGAAQWNLRAFVSKSSQGPYIVKVERMRKGTLVGTNHGSDIKLDEAARLASTNLVESIATALPEKNVQTTSNYTSSASEERAVAANGELSSPQATEVEAKHPNFIKNWFAAIGPAISNSLVGTNGTKFSLNLGYTFGLAEHFNLQYMVDGSFNTGSMGGTSSIIASVGCKYYLFDRLSDFSPFAMIDVGYGGGNRANDSTGTAGVEIGFEFFRTQSSTFMAYFRNYVMFTNNGSTFANYPNINEIMVGINF